MGTTTSWAGRKFSVSALWLGVAMLIKLSCVLPHLFEIFRYTCSNNWEAPTHFELCGSAYLKTSEHMGRVASNQRRKKLAWARLCHTSGTSSIIRRSCRCTFTNRYDEVKNITSILPFLYKNPAHKVLRRKFFSLVPKATQSCPRWRGCWCYNPNETG